MYVQAKSSRCGLLEFIGSAVARNFPEEARGGYGGYGSGSFSDSCAKIDIDPDLVVIAIIGFMAPAAFLLYQAITAGRRRRRDIAGIQQPNYVTDLVTLGRLVLNYCNIIWTKD